MRHLHLTVPPRIRTPLLPLLTLCAALTLTATPALALRGHVFGKAFGAAGSGPGQFKAPAGVAVNEATGAIYVVDKGNDRIEVFDSKGVFQSEIKGPFTTATGTGTLTSGSVAIEAVATTTGAFGVGQEISAPGLQAGTTIVAVDQEKGELEVSQPATTSEAASLTSQQSLSGPETIAVDNACVRQKLSETSKPKTCKEVDPSNGDVYVQDGFSHKVIDKFSAAGAFIGQVVVPQVGPFIKLTGVAVDSGGDLWVADTQSGLRFDRFGNEVENKSKGFVPALISGALLEPGLAVDSKENIYSATTFSAPVEEAIAKFNAKGELLNLTVDEEAAANGESSTGVATELPSDNAYIDNVTSVRRFDAKEPPGEVERFGLGDLSGGSGIAVNSATGQVYVADAAANQVAEFPLEEPGPPTIAGESVAEVTANSASFRAEINPRGANTEYRFEYGPCETPSTCPSSAYEKSTPVPDGPVGEDFEVHEVSTHPQDLAAGSVYHFRVIAHNEKDKPPGTVVVGAEQSFTTQPAGVFGLPDGRAWELVSPPEKHGTRIEALGFLPIQAAAAGNAITYRTNSPTEAEPQGYSNGVQVLSSRGPGGWSSHDLTLAHEQATGQSVGQGSEYRFSSQDLSLGVMQPLGAFNPALSEEATEQTPYLRSNYLGGDVSQFCTSKCLRPLVTAANVAEGVQFGEEGKCPPHPLCGPVFVGASDDARHVVLSSNVGLTSYPQDKGGLYEWSDGSLQLLSVLPDGEAASAASNPSLGRRENLVARHAVSPDGQRVVWSAGALYLRDTSKGETGETIALAAGLTGSPEFQTASADVSKVFFTDNGELYLYDTESKDEERITPIGAGVQGLIAGASEDGSYVYFVGNGQLAEGAVKGTCHGEGSGAANACNLYELHESGGAWEAPRLVAVLSGEDFPDFRPYLQGLTARVSPDGRFVAFMSQRSLTGYDNRDAQSGKRDQEVYLYDASANHLACASCNATGARPEGVEYKQLEGGLVAGNLRLRPTTWLAGNVPGWTPYRGSGASQQSLHQSRYLSDSGRLFFNSSDALSPQDVNGTEDVYQYEPPGVGGCSSSSATFSERTGGCVALISAGTSREESGFLDASESGSDVFFLTASKLTKGDFDTAIDVYDAHECTAASPCLPEGLEQPPPCTSEASCKASPTPQPEIFGAPASATFSGLGNIVPSSPPAKPPTRAQLLAKALGSCRKAHRKSKKRRSACEAQARKRYGAKKATAKKGAKR